MKPFSEIYDSGIIHTSALYCHRYQSLTMRTPYKMRICDTIVIAPLFPFLIDVAPHKTSHTGCPIAKFRKAVSAIRESTGDFPLIHGKGE